MMRAFELGYELIGAVRGFFELGAKKSKWDEGSTERQLEDLIFIGDVDDDDMIQQIALMIAEAKSAGFNDGVEEALTDEEDAYDSGKEEGVRTAKQEAEEFLTAAHKDWLDIVESFRRGDMDDVRTRMMDHSRRVFNDDVWIDRR